MCHASNSYNDRELQNPSANPRPKGHPHAARAGGLSLTILQRLARKATSYGVRPEDIGPISTFTDGEYMALYLKHTMGRWGAPAVYGVRPKDQERARRAWEKLIARVRPLKPGKQYMKSKRPA